MSRELLNIYTDLYTSLETEKITCILFKEWFEKKTDKQLIDHFRKTCKSESYILGEMQKKYEKTLFKLEELEEEMKHVKRLLDEQKTESIKLC